MMHDDWKALYKRLIGKPFKWGAHGPDAYDCGTVVVEVLAALGKTAPASWLIATQGQWGHDRKETVSFIRHSADSRIWQKITEAEKQPGDVVAMGPSKKIHHVGVVTPYGIMHTDEQLGVINSPCEGSLRSHGYQRIEFYRWVG